MLTQAPRRRLRARPIDQEIFQCQCAFPAVKGSATIPAGNLAIGRLRIDFDTDQLVFGPAIRTVETRYIGFRHGALPASRCNVGLPAQRSEWPRDRQLRRWAALTDPIAPNAAPNWWPLSPPPKSKRGVVQDRT
jgi:hypothetical protein